jgi:hypothetical protein
MIDKLLLIMLCLSIVAMLIVAVWLFWPYDVIQHEFGPLPLENTVLHVGDVIAYHAKYEKYNDALGYAQVQLVDHVLILFPSVIYSGASGKQDMWNRSYTVPINTPPGKNYYLQFVVEYRVNPIRTVVERYRTDEFEVIE